MQWESDGMMTQSSGSLQTQRCFMFISKKHDCAQPGWLFYMVRKIKMDSKKYGKTRGLMLRTDQAEALRIASAATRKSENAFLVEIIRERIEKEKTMKGEPDGQNKIL